MPHIRYETGDRVGTIVIDRPEKKNAMTYGMLREFRAAMDEAANDPATRAIVLTGVPGAFCAGTDLSDLQDTPEEERSGRGGAAPDSPLVPFPLLSLPKPVVCAIEAMKGSWLSLLRKKMGSPDSMTLPTMPLPTGILSARSLAAVS